MHAYYWQLPRMATPAARLAACVRCLTAAGGLYFVGMLLNHTSDAHATSDQLPQTAAEGCRSLSVPATSVQAGKLKPKLFRRKPTENEKSKTVTSLCRVMLRFWIFRTVEVDVYFPYDLFWIPGLGLVSGTINKNLIDGPWVSI